MRHKNIAPVRGHPLLAWPASYALQSKLICRRFFSSDSIEYLTIGEIYGCTPILRPSELAAAESRACDVIAHALNHMYTLEGISPDILVLQHANAAAYTPSFMDTCIQDLATNPSLSSVIPAYEDADHHPFRAKTLNQNGLAMSFSEHPSEVSSNRQDLPVAIFYTHDFWVIRTANGLPLGPAPWPCHGDMVKPKLVAKPSVTDIHSPEDLKVLDDWLAIAMGRGEIREPQRVVLEF